MMKQGGAYDRSARMSMAATVSSLSDAAAAFEWGRGEVWQGGGCVRLAMGCRGRGITEEEAVCGLRACRRAALVRCHVVVVMIDCVMPGRIVGACYRCDCSARCFQAAFIFFNTSLGNRCSVQSR